MSSRCSPVLLTWKDYLWPLVVLPDSDDPPAVGAPPARARHAATRRLPCRPGDLDGVAHQPVRHLPPLLHRWRRDGWAIKAMASPSVRRAGDVPRRMRSTAPMHPRRRPRRATTSEARAGPRRSRSSRRRGARRSSSTRRSATAARTQGDHDPRRGRRAARRATQQACVTAVRSTEGPRSRRTPRSRARPHTAAPPTSSVRPCRRRGTGRGGTAPAAYACGVATHTAYSTVQWPHVRLCSNSLGVYCASWMSRSTPRHSSSTDSATWLDRRAADGH